MSQPALRRVALVGRSRPCGRGSLLLLALAVAGCSVGPTYHPPEPPVGDGWSHAEAAAAPVTPEELGRWWQRFDDPVLDRLVETALAQNLGVREANARVAEARAVRDRVAGRRLPEAAALGSVTERRQSENGPLPIDRIPELERDQTIFDLGLDASWEIDLFGRTRRALEAAEARLESSREEHRAAQFRVAAEVTRSYLALRGGQRRLAAVESALRSVSETAELVELRVEEGEAAPLELQRVETDLRALEARLPQQRAELRAAALALSTLTGALPEGELALLEEEPPALRLGRYPVGERAELLRRRPDVRAAERRLAAATADVGVAVAELYPRLSIGARGGFQALEADELFDASSVTWSIVPAISWRFFDGGRVRAEIRIAEARAAAAAVAWEGVVLEALGDAERALARYLGELDSLELRNQAVSAAGRTRDLERLRYEAGESSLLQLLDAERRLDEERAALAAAEIEASSQLVALIKALGGGWADEPEPITPLVAPRSDRDGRHAAPAAPPTTDR